MDAEEISWQLTTFLAQDSTSQIDFFSKLLTSDSSEDSFEKGVSARLVEAAKLLPYVKNSFLDSAELVHGGALNELHALALLMLRDLDAEYWSTEGLKSSHIWNLVRRLARLVLWEAGLGENLPPDWFPVAEIFDD
jgi:hypothetical protein